MYETASKRVYKSKRCGLFMTFRPSQRTLFMARRNWELLALRLTSDGIRSQYNCSEEVDEKDEKRKFLAKPNNFGTKIFLMFLLRKCIPTLDVFNHK